MKVSIEGLYAIARHEGIVPYPYLDAVNVWTFGIGHAETSGLEPNPRHMPKGVINERLVFDLFKRHIGKYEAGVLRAVKVPLAQHEFDALVSFHFNTGAIAKASATRVLNEGGSKAEVVRRLKLYNKAGGRVLIGLTARRAEEADMFLHGRYPSGPIPVWNVNASNKPGWVVRSMPKDEAMRLLSGREVYPAPQRPAQPQVTPKASGGYWASLWAAIMAMCKALTRKPEAPKETGPKGFVPVFHDNRTIWVMPDFYKRDGIRMPVDLPEALRIAQERSRAVGYPLRLPSKEHVDSIHKAAKKFVMPTRAEPRRVLATYQSVDAEIERMNPSGLVSGHKKEILRPAVSGKVTIYGGMKADGSFWQPRPSSVHGETYTDYSHGLRLVYDPEDK